MTRPVKQEVPRMDISEFYNLLNNHTWSFKANSYYEFAQLSKKERELEAIAWTNGPYFVECYLREFKATFQNNHSVGYTAGYSSARASYESMIDTGDKEYDAFRKMVRNHDYWYFYSDDINVYNSGHETSAKIMDIVKEKKGMYETYWKYFNDKQQKASEAAIRGSKK